jgi:hypothetical protein
MAKSDKKYTFRDVDVLHQLSKNGWTVENKFKEISDGFNGVIYVPDSTNFKLNGEVKTLQEFQSAYLEINA